MATRNQNGVHAVLGGPGACLRVTTPVTTNGVLPLLVNGQQQTEETFLPITAKRQLERKNARLLKNGFGHLVAKIEIVGI